MRNWVVLTVAGVSWSFLGACGSSDDPKSQEDNSLEQPNEDIALDNEGGDGDETGFTLAPGPLSDEQLDALLESACAGWSYEPELAPAVLQLVIDVSGSMDLPPENGDSETKWVTTREALRDTIESLPGTISLGVTYYPNMSTTVNCSGGNSPCEPGPSVDVSECVNLATMLDVDKLGAPGSDHRAGVVTSLDEANPAGGTPTHDAYNVALAGLVAAKAAGQRFMLLITDGQPTFLEGCSGSGYRSQPVDEQPIIEAISAARDDGIKTFVIGSPGSEENADTGDDARPWLSRAATEGGTATEGCDEEGPNFCHFDMSQVTDFSGALRQALASITGQITSCDLNVPPPLDDTKTIDPTLVNVVLTPFDGSAEVLARVDDTECKKGWNYGDSFDTITLCEDSCLRLRENSSSGIELLFGCQAAGVPVR